MGLFENQETRMYVNISIDNTVLVIDYSGFLKLHHSDLRKLTKL